jgi:hypothetical protein
MFKKGPLIDWFNGLIRDRRPLVNPLTRTPIIQPGQRLHSRNPAVQIKLGKVEEPEKSGLKSFKLKIKKKLEPSIETPIETPKTVETSGLKSFKLKFKKVEEPEPPIETPKTVETPGLKSFKLKLKKVEEVDKHG